MVIEPAVPAQCKAHSSKCLEKRETWKGHTTDAYMVEVIDGHQGQLPV